MANTPTSRNTLSDYVAELERRMIANTLSDCGGT
jgi:hypothetical protein